MTTLADARAELLARGLDGLDPARAKRCVNLGVQRVSRYALWPFLYQFNDSAALPYTNPAIHRVVAVRVPGRSGQLLPYAYDADPLEPGSTARAWTYAQDMAITAVPSESGLVVSIAYYRMHPVLVDDDDPILIPDAYEHVVLDAAAVEASKDLREWESIAGFKAELAEGLAEMVEALIDPQLSSTRYVEMS